LVLESEFKRVRDALKAQEEAITSINLSSLMAVYEGACESIMILQPTRGFERAGFLYKRGGADQVNETEGESTAPHLGCEVDLVHGSPPER
jgi:hypothetical protein